MKIGEEYEVTILEIAPNGEGIGRIKNYPVFIKNVKLNEQVKVRITNLVAGFVDAELVT